LIVSVQSKATDGSFKGETDSELTYTCKERDLRYWLRWNLPVILVYSRPKSNEAYWISNLFVELLNVILEAQLREDDISYSNMDNANTLSISETVYRRKLRPYGKTPGSVTKVHLSEGLANELWAWKAGVRGRIPRRLHVPECRRRLHGRLQLSLPSAQAVGRSGRDRVVELPNSPADGP